MLEFFGSQLFRQRLVLATVSGKPVKISKIRSQDANPGLKGRVNQKFLSQKAQTDDEKWSAD